MKRTYTYKIKVAVNGTKRYHKMVLADIEYSLNEFEDYAEEESSCEDNKNNGYSVAVVPPNNRK